MRRRDFIKLIAGSSAAWPFAFASRAQQPSRPVIGFLNGVTAQERARPLAAFLKGLGETGYADGRNVVIEYRWANGQYDRLPAMAADLVRRQVSVIAATTTPAALAAKATTTSIPIVFEVGADPIKLGLVANLNRPGGNITGVTQTNVEIAPKRLQLLHELIPSARIIAFLVSPADPLITEPSISEVSAAAHALGLDLHVVNASNEDEIDAAFAKLSQIRAEGVVVGGGPFFAGRTEQLAALALKHSMPTIYEYKRFVAAGGLMSYGSEISEAYRLAGIYTGRVLKGDKPADLPVQQATKVELLINLRTAKALGITVPNTLIGRADEVIE